jgi:hypothetical protein
MGSEVAGGTPGRPSKVARLIEQHGFDEVGAELERRWTADDPDERQSLRELASYFNRRILAAALADTGVQPLDGEVSNLYRLLTGDDVSVAERTRAERQLERDGVDVDELQADFVSYQAIRTYLTSHRDAEYDRDEGESLERALESIQRLRSRTASVAESRLEQLRESDRLSLGSPRVTVDVRVLCEDCGAQFDVGDLDGDGCDCP